MTDENSPLRLACSTRKAVDQTLAVKQSHKVMHNMRASFSQALITAEKKYQKRPRRKTKEGKYDPEQQPPDEGPKPDRSRIATRKRAKSSTALDRGFSAPNIKSARVTLERSGPGFFNKSKSSNTVHGRDLPDLTFSHTNDERPRSYSRRRGHAPAGESRMTYRQNARSKHSDREIISPIDDSRQYLTQGLMPRSQRTAPRGSAERSIRSSWNCQIDLLERDTTSQPQVDTPAKCKQVLSEDGSNESCVTWSSSSVRQPRKEPERNTLQSFSIKTDEVSSRSPLNNSSCKWPKHQLSAHSTKLSQEFDQTEDSDTPRSAAQHNPDDLPSKFGPVISLQDLKALANITGSRTDVDQTSQQFQDRSRLGTTLAMQSTRPSITPYGENHAKGPTSVHPQRLDRGSNTPRLEHDFQSGRLPNDDKFPGMELSHRFYQHATGARADRDGHTYIMKDVHPTRALIDSEGPELDAFDMALLQQTRYDRNMSKNSTHPLVKAESVFVEVDDLNPHVNSSGGQIKATAHGPPQRTKLCHSSHATARNAHGMTAKDACNAKTRPPLLRPSLTALDKNDDFILFGQPHFAY